MTIAPLFSMGTCIVRLESVRVNFETALKTFQSLSRNDYQCPHCASLYQVLNICFQDQTSSLFFSFDQGVYLFDESPKSSQYGTGDVYCPGKIWFNREKCEFFDGYITTPRSIYGC